MFALKNLACALGINLDFYGLFSLFKALLKRSAESIRTADVTCDLPKVFKVIEDCHADVDFFKKYCLKPPNQAECFSARTNVSYSRNNRFSPISRSKLISLSSLQSSTMANERVHWLQNLCKCDIFCR